MKKYLVGAIALMLVLTASGCTTKTTVDGAGGPSSGGDSAAAKTAAAFIAKAEAPVKMVSPAGPNFTPKPGKVIGVLSCGEASAPCARISAAEIKAIKALGYDYVLADGQLAPPGLAAGMMTLIERRVDVIISDFASDAVIPVAVAAAHAAGIPIVCANCQNSALPPVDNPSTVNVNIDADMQGQQMGNFALAKSGGAVKAVAFTMTPFPALSVRAKKAIELIKGCGGCEVLKVEEIPSVPEQQQRIREMVAADLQRYGPGELNYIIMAADYPGMGAIQAIQAAGRDDVKVVSSECELENIDVIRAGGPQVMCANGALEWSGWAAVDAAARVLAGQKPTDVVIPIQLVSATANLPGAGQFAAGPDYRAEYLRQWGLH
ncbi:substrate-binding domain-containing protein [Arthrobacter sp. NPDC080073]|uniref:sugar ABC transporter substrate-binding protein n=1 Tax=Arthrobacter sp. NPDC080073 TaxID=3155919 RepID=UPI003431389D